MKKVIFAILLSALPVFAQAPPGAPVVPNPGLPTPVPGGPRTNRQELLQRALQDALRTNAPAAAALGPGLAPANTNVTVNQPDPIPAPVPGPGSIIVPTPSPADVDTNGMIAINPPAAAANIPPEEMLPAGTINFPATDLNQVLQIYAELVNRTVLRPTALPAPTITLRTQTPVTKEEARQALDSVLALNGITMIPIGDKFVKAVPVAQSGQEGAPFNKVPTEQLPDLGSFVTHVTQLKFTKPSEIVQALQPFAKIPNAILPIDSSQILVLRDYTENVKRMLQMIREIDVAVPSEFISEVIPIKYALASEIANALNSLSSGGGGATVGGGATGTGAAGPTRTSFGGSSRPGFGTSRTGGYGGYGNPMMPGQLGTQTGVGGATAPGGSSFTQRLQNIIQRASVSGDIVVLGQTKIIADERTNSLLIFASREDMKMIKDVVSKLDVVLAQVLIEAVILEVALKNNKELGVSYLQYPQSSGDWTGVGAGGAGNFYRPGEFLFSGGTNGTAGALKGGFNYLLRYNQDLDVTVTALAANSRAKVLQRPRIQTSHAVQAQLFVGESRPYPTASYYGGGAYGSYSSIQQLQIGVTLDVTPLINPDGLVVMDIHQTIENYAGFTEITGVGNVPNTTRKEAAAKVAVRDRDTIILGGLIANDRSTSGSGIPILMDIPLLGALFRKSTSDENRSELIVLIRPTVLPTPEIAALTATAEKDRMPGVKAAEAEFKESEAKRLKAADREEKKSSKGNFEDLP